MTACGASSRSRSHGWFLGWLLAIFVASTIAGSAVVTDFAHDYDTPAVALVDAQPFTPAEATPAQLSGSRQWSASPSMDARRAPTTSPRSFIATEGVGALEEASNAAFKAADDIGDFSLSAKHLPGAGGNWNRFAAGVDPNEAIVEALRSPSAQFFPNGEGTFKVVTDLGFQVGEKTSQTAVRVIVTTDGRIITAFPVKP